MIGTMDFYARRLIQHGRFPGNARLALLGRAETLIRRERISAHRRIPAADGTVIDTWVIRPGPSASPREARATALLLHGLWDSKAQFLRAGERLAERGFDVVLPDLRAHGRSLGRVTSFGAREVGDLQTVLKVLAEEELIAGPRYVVGFSMGGGIAVQLAAQDSACRGVLAIAPLADARAGMRRVLRFLAPWMGEARAQATVDRAGELGRFRPDDVSAVAAASRLRCPLLVLHGRWDLTVPVSHGRRIHAAAAGPKRLVTVPWRGHNTTRLGRTRWITEAIDGMARGDLP